MNKKGLLVLSSALLCFGAAATLCLSPSLAYGLVAEDADDGKCAEALDWIDLNVDTTQVVSSFRLPNKGQYGADISWTSSVPASLSIITDSVSGYVAKVSRGDSNVSVTLTATASLKGSVSASKEFALTILKKSGGVVSDLPLALSEDFSSYETGVELSNYFIYESSSSDQSAASAVTEVSKNINDMPSSKALSLNSVRTASSLSYTRTLNVKAAEAPDGAVLEGDFLVQDETNGLSIELLHSGSVIAGVKVSTSQNQVYESGGYASCEKNGEEMKKAEAGVWEHFRIFFKPSSGRSIVSIYDFKNATYKNLSSCLGSYFEGSGTTSGTKGDVDGLRFSLARGSKFGKTYLANLKLDVLANMPETTPTNHNRAMGLGSITGYEETIFAYDGETIEGINPSFVVHNRFDEETVLVKDTDYTVSLKESELEDNSKLYVYSFLLTGTGETIDVKQYVYFSDKNAIPSFDVFKGSYLKHRKVDTADYGYITISGTIGRGDSLIYYAVYAAGSASPSAESLINGDSNGVGYKLGGNMAIATHEFSLDSGNLAYNGEYDVYAVAKNANGVSEIYSSKGISTIVNISSCEEFHDMSSNLDTLASTFRLTQDLDFSSYYWEFDGTSRSFTGSLDGQNHVIKNLTIANASTDGSVKTGIFFNFNGTVKNLTFDNAKVSGYTDVGILGGNAYGCTVSHVSFIDCTVSQDEEVSGGDGYFAAAVGRCRGGDNLFEDITIDGATIEAPQRAGLLVAATVGSSQSCKVTIKNVIASGSISESGAQAGLIGRNQSADITMNNVIVTLNVLSSKKEVASILGRNETGGSLNVVNGVGNLTIKFITQNTYFGQFIGYDAKMTGSGGLSFDYTVSGFSYFDNDYSELGDSITPIKNAVTAGKSLSYPETWSEKWWDQNTFLRDIDTSLSFSYEEISGWPILDIKESIVGTAVALQPLVDAIDLNDVSSCHYEIYKANDLLPYLSASEKEKLTSGSEEKIKKAKESYIALYESLADIGEGI